MWAYTLRRLLYAVPVLLGVSMLVFALIHLAPGDVVDILVPPEVPKEIADRPDGFEIEILGKRRAARIQSAPLFDANFERLRA